MIGRHRAVLLGFASVLLLPSCAADRRPPEHTLRILYQADERSLQPAYDDVPRFLVFSPLVLHDTNESFACGEPEPGLAVRWEADSTYREWTLSLRTDVAWHDGAPFTAYDVKFTLDLWRHPDVLHWGAGPLDSAVVEDDHTIRLFYDRPTRQPINGWDVFYPRHLLETLEPAEFWEWDFWTRPIGTGPFRYVRHVPRTMTEFEASPDYFAGRPGVDRVVVKWGGGDPAAELQSRGVDVVEGIAPNLASRLGADVDFRAIYAAYPGAVWLYWNQAHPALADAAVRRALTHAIDRRSLHAALYYPADLPLTDGVYSRCQFARRDLPPAWPHDDEAAATLLAEAGWHDADGDGVRSREGVALRFNLLAPSQWLEGADAAVFIQSELRDIGIDVDVTLVESHLVNDRLAQGEFDAAMYIVRSASPIDAFGARSAIGYRNAVFNGLLDRADVTMDLEARDRLYTEATAIFRQDLPATFLYPKTDAHVAHARVAGFDASIGDVFMRIDRLRLRGQ